MNGEFVVMKWYEKSIDCHRSLATYFTIKSINLGLIPITETINCLAFFSLFVK